MSHKGQIQSPFAPARQPTCWRSRTATSHHTKCYSCVWRINGKGFGKININIITTQKWVNLLSLMLDAFKKNGHCVTMDSTTWATSWQWLATTCGALTWWEQRKQTVPAPTSIAQFWWGRGHTTLSVGSIYGDHFVSPFGPTTLSLDRCWISTALR